MTVSEKEEIYLLKRDKVESNRLNDQHDFLITVSGGNVIHETIPREGLSAVADIATGTGVWIKDVAKTLAKNYPSDKPRYYHGFDISSAQFPGDADSEIHYSVQDCLRPFPAEHHNRYDLVNVRLLVSAIKQEDYEKIVANLVQIIKPGGYLQWCDLDLQSYINSIAPRWRGSAFETVQQLCIDVQLSAGLSLRVLEDIAHGAQKHGLTDIYKHYYSTGDHRDLDDYTRKWCMAVFKVMVPAALVRLGKRATEEEAMAETARLLPQVEKEYKEGLVPMGDLGVVTAKKPL